MTRPALVDELMEALAPLGDVAGRRTFGEGAVYIDKRMTGLIIDDELYLKVDDATLPDYDGRKAFTYEMNGKIVTTSYRQVPDDVYDDPTELLRRTAAAIAIAARAPILLVVVVAAVVTALCRVAGWDA